MKTTNSHYLYSTRIQNNRIFIANDIDKNNHFIFRAFLQLIAQQSLGDIFINKVTWSKSSNNVDTMCIKVTLLDQNMKSKLQLLCKNFNTELQVINNCILMTTYELDVSIYV